MPTSVPNFNFPAPLVTEIKRVSQNLMWWLLLAYKPLPYSVRWNFYVCSKYLARSNSVPNFSIVSLCIMQLCEYVFSVGFPCAHKWGFWGFWRWRCEILSSNSQKALPCVNTRMLVYRVSKSVQQPELYRSVERFCVQRNKKIEW